MRKILKLFVPPILKNLWRYNRRYGWSGNYSSWDAALKASSGYDEKSIFEKVRASALMVKNGEAVFERDSVIHTEIDYSLPLTAAILWAASVNNNRLHLLDFGGSLGTGYFQNRVFLKNMSDVKWGVVEQQHYVECGKKEFQSEQLKFYTSIADCSNSIHPNIIIFISSLQYIREPYALIDEVFKQKIEFFLIERAGFTNDDEDRLTAQNVAPEYYKASYPCWFLSKKKFLTKMVSKYDLVNAFDNGLEYPIGLDTFRYEGMLFRLRR